MEVDITQHVYKAVIPTYIPTARIREFQLFPILTNIGSRQLF